MAGLSLSDITNINIYEETGSSAADLINAHRASALVSPITASILTQVKNLRGDKPMIINPHSDLMSLTGVLMLHDKIFETVGTTEYISGNMTGNFDGNMTGNILIDGTAGKDTNEIFSTLQNLQNSFFVHSESLGQLDNVSIGKFKPAEIIASTLKLGTNPETAVDVLDTIDNLKYNLEQKIAVAKDGLKPIGLANYVIDDSSVIMELSGDNILVSQELPNDRTIVILNQTNTKFNGLWSFVSYVGDKTALSRHERFDYENPEDEISVGDSIYVTGSNDKDGSYVVITVDTVNKECTIAQHTNTSSVNTLTGEVGTLSTTVGTLSTTVGTLSTNVGTLSTNVGTLSTEVSGKATIADVNSVKTLLNQVVVVVNHLIPSLALVVDDVLSPLNSTLLTGIAV